MKQINQHIAEKLIINKSSKKKEHVYFVPNTLVEFNEYVKRQKENAHMSGSMYGTKENPLDLTYIDFGQLPDEALSYYFYEDQEILYLDMSDCRFGQSMNSIDNMFANMDSCKEINVSNWDLGSITILTGLFSECVHLYKIEGLNTIDFSNITRMSGMFRECHSLEELDLSNWNLSEAIRLVGIFGECSSLKKVDLSDWDKYSSNFQKCNKMFYECKSLETIKGIENWDLSKCENLSKMFYNCEKLKVNLDNWKIHPDPNLSDMFTNTNISPVWYK